MEKTVAGVGGAGRVGTGRPIRGLPEGPDAR